jgi:hypothetical protein
MLKNKLNEAERQEKTRELEKKLVKELWPMLVGLKQRVDRRLVKTCLGLVMAIEMAIRYHKSELAFESPRLLKWNARQKLLLIAALAYAYLLSFLPSPSIRLSGSLVITAFLPADRKAEPGCSDPALSLASCFVSLLVLSSPPFLSTL